MPQTKIATCCYCGTRAALVLRGRDRHELTCSSCGAPLHDMKALRADAVNPALHRTAQRGKKGETRHEGWHGAPVGLTERKVKPDRRRKKKRKTLAKRFFEEAFDIIEDILD